jgi:hypothetical protein
MKHLTKFIEYLKESKEELDLDLIVNDFLVPIKHLGVKIDTYKSLVTSGEFAGYNKTTISLIFEHFDRVDGESNTYIKDKRLWELLDELIMFKNVMDETYGNSVTVWLAVTKIDIDIYSKVEENDKYLIEKLYNEFRKHYSKKIHYDVSKKEDSMSFYISGTKRVWDNYIRDYEIDLSKYDLKFIDSENAIDKEAINRYWNAKLKIVITVKK